MDLARAPIDLAVVRAAMSDPDRWTLQHCVVTGSSNADLVAAAADAAEGTVLITEEQTAGRGRLGRSWQAPRGSSVMISILLRPPVPAGRRSWLGALLGLALVTAIRRCTGLPAELKWPNDVLIAGRKCAGILAEAIGDAVIVGTGLNVTLSADELPADPGATPATSLLLAAGGRPTVPDRAELVAALLDSYGELYDRWRAAAGDMSAAGLLTEYRNRCATLDSAVRVDLPDGAAVIGTATDVADDGALLVRDEAGRLFRFAAADVRHLRPAPAGSDRR